MLMMFSSNSKDRDDSNNNNDNNSNNNYNHILKLIGVLIKKNRNVNIHKKCEKILKFKVHV